MAAAEFGCEATKMDVGKSLRECLEMWQTVVERINLLIFNGKN